MEALPLPPLTARPALGSRSLFPTLQARVYANHGAISPPSLAVAAAGLQVLDDVGRHGVASVMRWMDQRERLRRRLGRLLGVAPETLGFAPSTSHGVLAIAFGLDWCKGDRILCFHGEFPTNVSPWQRAAETFGLHVDFLPLSGFDDGSGAGLGRVEAWLANNPRSRLVAVSAVQFQTGLRMPLAELSALVHAHGAELFVDGIQAVGGLDLDLVALDVDYLAAGSHKWLMGLEGCAFHYISPACVGSLKPRLASWLSHEEPVSFLMEGPGHLRYDRPVRQQADFTELGAQNSLGFNALEASLALIEELGLPAIEAHVQAWHDAVEPGVVALGFRPCRAADLAARSNILSFLPPEGVDTHALVVALGALGVAASNPDGHLRLSPHWPNALDEAPVVVDALAQALPLARS